MESAMPQIDRTIGDVLPWATMTLDYTEQIAELIPDELLDQRPTDPSGKFCFSPAELVMHCADARRMFAGQLIGEAQEDAYWSGGPDDEGVWEFKPYEGKDALLKSLRDTRALLTPYLERPANDLLAETEGTRASFDKNLEYMREHNHDTTRMERAGAPNIMRVLFAIAVHEAGHRGALQTLLRQHGINHSGEM